MYAWALFGLLSQNKKPELTPPLILHSEKVDIQTKHIFDWYISNFNKLPQQYSSLQKYCSMDGDINIPGENLPDGDFRGHLANLMIFLLGDRDTLDGLNDDVGKIIASLINETEKDYNKRTTINLDDKEIKELKWQFKQRKKQLERAVIYFKNQAALLAFIQGLSYEDGDFEDVIIQEHQKYHVKYFRVSTTFDSYEIPNKLNSLLKEAQREKKENGTEIDELLAENAGLSEIEQLQSLEKKSDNILEHYIH